jgi:hypothetical protein
MNNTGIIVCGFPYKKFDFLKKFLKISTFGGTNLFVIVSRFYCLGETIDGYPA